MNETRIEPTKMLFSVTARGNGRLLISELKKASINFNLQFAGKGTASSDMMDILGLDSNDKDLILSFGAESAVAAFAARLSDDLRAGLPVQGIMMILSPGAINNLIAIMTSYDAERSGQKGMKKMPKSEFDYSLVLIAINQGYTDSVMQTARKAGATGGTVIRARLAETEEIERFYGMPIQKEREILAIMAPSSARDSIMEAVSKDYGITTKAQAIICSLPIEKAFKL